MVRVGGKGHSQPCISGSISTQFRETAVECWLASSKPYAEAAICVKFI